MCKSGDKKKIGGVRFRIIGVGTDGTNVPIYVLKRVFDNSLWYVRTRHVTRFSRIKRIPDIDNAKLDPVDLSYLVG